MPEWPHKLWLQGTMPLKKEIIYSRAAVDISCQPFLVGDDLSELAKEASADFIRHLGLGREAAATGDDAGAGGAGGGADEKKYVALEILNGGHYYYVPAAFEAVTGRSLPVASLRAKRGQVDGKWQVRIWEESWKKETDAVPVAGGELAGAHVLIGDTIATGTTLAGVLNFVCDQMEAAGAWGDVSCFTIVGSATAEPLLQAVADRLEAHGKELRIVFANACFPLADDGTDMGFHFDPTTPEGKGGVWDATALAQFRERLGDYAPHMKCAIWDWGDRFREIDSHLAEIEHYYGSTTPPAPEWLTAGIARVRASRASAAAE